MELMDTIRQRKSVRKYLDKPVEREKIVECIEAARLAPSADNIQPWRFIIIDSQELKMNFCRYVCRGIFKPTRFIERAPAIIIILAKLNIIVHRIAKVATRTDLYLLDIGIAGEHLVLQAQELGIGTCWINWFNVKKAQSFLQIPNKYRVISLIAMGYAGGRATKFKPDLPLEEILFFNDDYKKKL